MPKPYRPVDPSQLRTYSVAERAHLSAVERFAGLPEPGGGVAALIDALPDFLGAAALRTLVQRIVEARRADRPVVWALGAHVIKVGCSPVVVDLIRRGVVTAVAMHGATAIHDLEVAAFGQTSEDVAETIRTGMFGMVRETAAWYGKAARSAAQRSTGLGEALGRIIEEHDFPHRDFSILAEAVRAGIPATVHVAVGTDTVHMLPDVDGAALGQASMHDFRLICDVVCDLAPAPGSEVGGVWCNIGSAVILPEVFLKAVAVARNLGADLDAMTTANLDMLRHYRPGQNVLTRPVASGRGLEIVGQHEILLPLLRMAILERQASVADTAEQG